MENTICGFIGTGNMGGALAQAACKGVGPQRVLLANRTRSKAQTLADQLGCTVTDNRTIAQRAQMIFLGVKPQMMAALLDELAPTLAARRDRFVLVSMAAGLTTERIAQLAGGDYPVIRIMPNTPVAQGCGMVLLCHNAAVQPAEVTALTADLAAAGRFDALEERLMDAGSAVSGCGPAYVYLFIEALADGGVACGLPRQKAQEYAAQTLLGASQLVLQSGQHPGALKDAVCSPGGSTIQGVRALESRAFRAAAAEAVIAAYDKTKELGK